MTQLTSWLDTPTAAALDAMQHDPLLALLREDAHEPYCLHCGDHGYLWIHGDDDMPCPWCNRQESVVPW